METGQGIDSHYKDYKPNDPAVKALLTRDISSAMKVHTHRCSCYACLFWQLLSQGNVALVHASRIGSNLTASSVRYVRCVS